MTFSLARHTGTLDPEGQLVSTDRYPEFQAELRRFHPDLRLAFDREEGIWVIVRRDIEIRRVRISPKWDADEWLAYPRPVWTIVRDICWVTIEREPHPEGGAEMKILRRHYREPSSAVLREFLLWKQRGEDDRFTACPNKTMPRKIRKQGERGDRERSRRLQALAKDVVNDLGPLAGRPQIQVPA